MEKKTRITTLLMLFITSCFSLHAQKSVCACASYSSIQYKTNYEILFPPAVIKKNNIHQVVIYTSGHSYSDSVTELFDPYIELKLNFDAQGFVSSRIQYREGRANELYEFERDQAGNIIKQTFTYVDSLENKIITKVLPPQITDYEFNSKNQLVMEKSRSYDGALLPDKKATYTKYKYDASRRLITSERQMYFDFDPKQSLRSTTTYKYIDADQLVVSITKGNHKYRSIDSAWNDSTGNELSKRSYYPPVKNAVFDQHSTYVNGRLMTYTIITGEGGGSECPDKGSYTDRYFYSTNGLPESILNEYGDVVCEMGLTYLKN